MLILVNNSMAVVCRPAVLSTCLHLAYLIIQIVFRGGGGYSGVKKIGMTVGNPRNYPKNTKAQKFAHPKTYPWSKTNPKNTNKREFI